MIRNYFLVVNSYTREYKVCGIGACMQLGAVVMVLPWASNPRVGSLSPTWALLSLSKSLYPHCSSIPSVI